MQEQQYHFEAHQQHIRDQFELMEWAPARLDDNGFLLPLLSLDTAIEQAMDFILNKLENWFQGDPATLIDVTGTRHPVYFYYANLAIDGQVFRGAVDNYVSYPAFHHALFIETFLDYYSLKKNRTAIQAAVDLADWNIAHSTPVDWPYGGMPYSTFCHGKPGGFVDGASIMTDKAAIMALSYLRLHTMTGNTTYLNSARIIAEKLAVNQLPAGNWPFRVNPKTKEVMEAYTSSVIYPVKLFDAIAQKTNTTAYRLCRDSALRWIRMNPVKTGKWCGYYEDIPENIDNRTNWDCIDTVCYLLAHRDEDESFLDTAIGLVNYINETPIAEGKSFINADHPYSPAEGLREQKACFVTMSVHTAHWAIMMRDLAKATGDKTCWQRANQAMNLVTYCQQPTGQILTGFDYQHERSTVPFNQFWFSIHLGCTGFLIRFLETYSNDAVNNS